MNDERSDGVRGGGRARRGRKTVLVFGGSGMLGSEIVGRFEAAGGASGRNPAWIVRWTNRDIANYRNVDEAVGGAKPDVVVNCAGLTNVDRCEVDQALAYAVNAVGPSNLARACRIHGVPLFVHVSTDYVFSDGPGDAPGEPVVHRCDSRDFDPVNAYGLTKLAGELAVANEYAGRETGAAGSPDWVVVRTSRLYGRNRYNFPDFVCDVCLGARRPDSPLELMDGNFSVPTSATFLADRIFRIANRRGAGRRGAAAPRHVVHVVNPFRTAGDVPSLYGYADKVFEILSRLGLKPVRRFRSAAFGRAAAPDDDRRTARRPFSSILEPSAEETRGGRFWDEELACYIQKKFANGIKDVR